MEIKFQKQKTNPLFFNKIKQDVKVISNIQHILEKIDEDGFLSILQKSFLTILDNEVVYAIKELTKIEKYNSSFDMRNQLTNNTYIFKENLKRISNFVSKLKSRTIMERESKRRKYIQNYQTRKDKCETREF